MKKPANTDYPLHDVIKERWSPVAFDPNRVVEPEKIGRLLEAARWAPSCFNEQPWRYLVFDRSRKEDLQKAHDCLMEGNAWAKAAPLLLLSVARDSFTSRDRVNRHAQYDVGSATENLILQGVALGLVSHQMAGFSVEKAITQFFIPEGYTPMAMIAVGYPGDVSTLPLELQERENAPRSRKGLAEIAFSGSWDRPFTATKSD